MSVTYHDEHSPNRSDQHSMRLSLFSSPFFYPEVLRFGLVNLFDLELSHPRKKDLTMSHGLNGLFPSLLRVLGRPGHLRGATVLPWVPTGIASGHKAAVSEAFRCRS